MICYKDRTFCSSDCENSECYRFFGPDQEKAAHEWWGVADEYPPVAFCNFSGDCPDYMPPR